MLVAMSDIFVSLEKEWGLKSHTTIGANAQPTLLAPTALRDALSDGFGKAGLFKHGEMNDASEALGSILECLDRALGSSRGTSFVHRVFKLEQEQRLQCPACGRVSRQMSSAPMSQLVSSFQLRTAVREGRGNMEAVLRDDSVILTCEAGGCTKKSPLTLFIRPGTSLPTCYTVVVGWEADSFTAEDVQQCMTGILTSIDLCNLYSGLGQSRGDMTRYALKAVVCYYGAHYLAYCRDRPDSWLYLDDATTRRVGSWAEVSKNAAVGRHLPVILVYENVFAVGGN